MCFLGCIQWIRHVLTNTDNPLMKKNQLKKPRKPNREFYKKLYNIYNCYLYVRKYLCFSSNCNAPTNINMCVLD